MSCGVCGTGSESLGQTVEVCVRSERFKFNAAHFVAFSGFRERMHGHNYTVSCRLWGETNASDGYVVDFGDIKKVVRAVCETLNERFLCPALSDAIEIGRDGDNVTLRCHDGAFFSIPHSDCAMLPIVHSTAEELAALLWRRTIEGFGIELLRARKVSALEIAVAEAPTQEARYLRPLSAYAELADEQPPTPPRTGCAARSADDALRDRMAAQDDAMRPATEDAEDERAYYARDDHLSRK